MRPIPSGDVLNQRNPRSESRTALLVNQAVVNLGVVVGVFPTKGLPLPFVSSGGSSLLVAMAAVGLLLNVSQRAEV